MGKNAPKFAVVLSGCGVYDGSEIHEAVLTLWAIDKHGASYQCFAPNIPQRHVVNHLTGEEAPESRNVLVESARIARGAVRDLKEYDARDFDVLIMPGGYGAAKNLSSFAVDGADCTVDPDVARAIRATHAAGKPIGSLCISPVIVAKLLGGVDLTIGEDADTAAAIEKMGGHHRRTGHGEVVVDARHRVVTSPCYMLDATIGQIAAGADAAVAALIDLAGRGEAAAAE